MNTALTKITKEAKAIRSRSPKKAWATAVKEASAMYRAGKLGKVAAPKKVGAVKKKVIAAVPRKRVGSVKVATSKQSVSAALGRVGKAKVIFGKIDKLEKERKAAKADLKRVIQLEINHLHNEAKKIEKSYR